VRGSLHGGGTGGRDSMRFYCPLDVMPRLGFCSAARLRENTAPPPAYAASAPPQQSRARVRGFPPPSFLFTDTLVRAPPSWRCLLRGPRKGRRQPRDAFSHTRVPRGKISVRPVISGCASSFSPHFYTLLLPSRRNGSYLRCTIHYTI
jgi:hypothetical protein